jgi:hypothetical protein
MIGRTLVALLAPFHSRDGNPLVVRSQPLNQLPTLMCLALSMAACSGGSAPGPTSPTQARAPEPTYTLSGVIVAETATGLVPIEGVGVQVNMTKAAFTDASGFYSIPGLILTGLAPNVSIGPFNAVTAWKPTYLNDTRTVTISGDTRHDIQLIRRATFTLSGVVSEMTANGLAPIAGVEIHDWSCDPAFPGNRLPTPADGCNYGLSHSTTTDTNGRYSVPGVYATRNLVCATKDGYEGNMADSDCGGYSTSLMLDGDTRFHIQLVRR